MPEKKEKKQNFLMYRNKPLVRCGNILYYGNMSDKYVVMLQIVNQKPFKDTEEAGVVQIQLMATDPDIRARDRIIKKSEKEGLFNAIDIGSIWLERQLGE
ncbi:MAG: hypothetical protein P4L75_01855 [Clostridia bacterium]|nr:hypothetical protein [Clostridia bacterium]MDR3644540.1 hypothetical protein [Clostridia bacterium]